MKTRHKPPTLVSMWMLDVFCCALGCVTLLWLLNTRVASDETKRASSALTDLQSARTHLLAVQTDYEKTRVQLNADLEDLKAKLVAVTTERDESARQLAVAKADVASMETKFAKAAANTLALEEILRKKQKEATNLTAAVVAATTSAEELQKLLRQKEREREDLAIKAKAAAEQLDDMDAKLRAIAKSAEDAKARAAAMAKTGDELASAKARARDLQKQLDDANANIIDLQGDKKKLADKVDRLRIESDNKFAGIAMTGKRVVFVVDMSGSMKLIDERTPAPGKWPAVVDAVGRVMRSIPDLEQYQVVTFSRKAQYLFGDGGWRPYRATSVKEVSDALSTIEPVGDTNLYEAFDLAFRLKSSGLDTVYLFSDGLPTSGPGLTPEQDRTLGETQRTELLSRHLRKTLASSWNPPGGRRVKINSVGFFYESPEVGAFLWALSRENDGAFVGMSRP
jgi:hypothetical protein